MAHLHDPDRPRSTFADQMTYCIYLVPLLRAETRQQGVAVATSSVLAGTSALAAQESAVNGFPKSRLRFAVHSPSGKQLLARPRMVQELVSPLV